MIPAIISAFKDDTVRLTKEETERHRLTAELELKKTIDTNKIKLEQRVAELDAESAQLKQKCSHEYQVQQLKEQTKEKELANTLQISKQNLELEKEKLNTQLAVEKLQVEKHKLDLDHRITMAKLQQESDKDNLLCGFLHKQSEKGITGPAFAYNGTVAKHLIQGKLGDDLMGSLNGLLEQQLKLDEAQNVGKRRQIRNVPFKSASHDDDEEEGYSSSGIGSGRRSSLSKP